MRTRSLLAMITLAAVVLVASCGGSSPARESQGKAQIDCLKSKGIEPKTNSDLALGVDDKFFRYGAPDPADAATKVDVFVFDDHDKAVKGRPAITLQNEDDTRNQVVDNTVVSYSQVPQTSFSDAVTACVQPSSAKS